MDYSLVVGVDSQNNELVVGIVGKLRCAVRLRSQMTHGLARLHSYLHMG